MARYKSEEDVPIDNDADSHFSTLLTLTALARSSLTTA